MTEGERQAYNNGFILGMISKGVVTLTGEEQQLRTIIDNLRDQYGYNKFIGVYDRNNIPTILGTSHNYIIVRHGDGTVIAVTGDSDYFGFGLGTVYQYINGVWTFVQTGSVRINTYYSNPKSNFYIPSHPINNNSFIFYCNINIYEQKLSGTAHVPGELFKSPDLDSEVPLGI